MEDAELARMMEGSGPYDPEDLASQESFQALLRAVDGN